VAILSRGNTFLAHALCLWRAVSWLSVFMARRKWAKMVKNGAWRHEAADSKTSMDGSLGGSNGGRRGRMAILRDNVTRGGKTRRVLSTAAARASTCLVRPALSCSSLTLYVAKW